MSTIYYCIKLKGFFFFFLKLYLIFGFLILSLHTLISQEIYYLHISYWIWTLATTGSLVTFFFLFFFLYIIYMYTTHASFVYKNLIILKLESGRVKKCSLRWKYCSWVYRIALCSRWLKITLHVVSSFFLLHQAKTQSKSTKCHPKATWYLINS